MKLPTFTEYYQTIKKIENCLENNDGTIEGFFERLEEDGLSVDAVMTSDIAGITTPLGFMRPRYPNLIEVSPDAPGAEHFIKKLKPSFKKRYGENWGKVLYGLAWKRYGKDAKNRVND